MARESNGITEQFRIYIQKELSNNRIPPNHTSALLQQLEYLKYLSDIRKGHLPTVRVHAILDTDETAHLDTTAIYYKPNKQVKFIQGRLIATNKKLSSRRKSYPPFSAKSHQVVPIKW